jgi:hypothetical protein
MKLRQITLSPLLRSLAAVVLLCWVAAVVACSTRCLHESSEADHMEQASATQGDSHGSDKDSHHDDSFCTALHSLTPQTCGPVFVKPDFSPAFATDFVATAQILAITPADAPITRQPPDRELLSTPLVCLGPAFRSQAPPVLL